MENLISSFVKNLTTTLRERPDTEISGAQLGELIISLNPVVPLREIVGVPAGPGTLSKFINIYLSDVLSRKRRQGVDWIYKIHPDAQKKLTDLLPSAWFVFEAPQISHLLAIRLPQQHVSVVRIADIEGEQDIRFIDAVSSEEHESIREAFLVKAHSEGALLHLDINSAIQKSSRSWASSLKADATSRYEEWTKFYKDSIVSILEKRLHDAGVEPQKIHEICHSFSVAKPEGKQPLAERKKPVPEGREKQIMDELGDAVDDAFRAAFIAVVVKMPIEDLRKISLPFGLAFDAATKNVKG